MTFDEFYQRACERHDEDVLLKGLPKPKSSRTLKSKTDDYYLAEMTRRVFQSGFVWRVIDAKWAGFEEAFFDFDVDLIRQFTDEQVHQLVQDTRIVRHRKKIESTIHNAGYVALVREEHGSFGNYLADWEPTDFVGLFAEMKKRGSRLGGVSAQYFLRFVGWDAPMMSNDVVAALVEAGVVTKTPTSKKAWAAVQTAFDEWHLESGKSYSQISYVLSRSTDA